MADVCGDESAFLFDAPAAEEMFLSSLAPPGLEADELTVTPPPGLEMDDLAMAPPPGLEQDMLDQAPMKIWLAELSSTTMHLEHGVPAKKRPAFADYAGTPRTLDPKIPAKKRMPAFLEGIAAH